MSKLRLFEVGDECFEYVDEVKLIGLNELERVVIGKKCFTKQTNGLSCVGDGHFCLKDCERLRELKIGCCSFSDYTVCEIENVPSLEVIEMNHNCFYYASLELKSGFERMK